jgi:hypothetical protein
VGVCHGNTRPVCAVASQFICTGKSKVYRTELGN